VQQIDEGRYHLITDQGRSRKNENESDDNERRFPKLALTGPAYALGLGLYATKILFGLVEKAHLSLSFVRSNLAG
jgi:hypothetical protein